MKIRSKIMARQDVARNFWPPGLFQVVSSFVKGNRLRFI